MGDASLTSRQLADFADTLTALLASHEVRPGAHVAVWTQPALETPAALIALAASGFVVVPLDPKLGTRELTHILGDAKPAIALAAEPSSVSGVHTLQTPSPVGERGRGARVRGGRKVDAAPLLILYTSGTTGLPKGAVLSAGNIAAGLDGLAAAWKWTREDTVVHALPLFHVHGLVLGLFGSVRNGGALHWFPRFEPRELAAALGQGTTMLFAVPTMYHRLAEAADSDSSLLGGLRHARLLVSGSAALPQRDQQRLEALTGRRVLERYGMTETLITCAVRADSRPSAGSVGPPIAGMEAKLVDEHRHDVTARDDATLGELAVRGPTVFLGYLNRPDATAAVLDADGWFYTGDIACMRDDGSVRIVGRRATDLIKCGGYKVGAGEVEAALLEHPLVREAAVVGRPDADLGEKIVAYVVTSAPVEASALQDFVAKLLSPHKRPREVQLVRELPRNAMGKVVKSRLA